ncbi:RICIN domain-containing protein [Pectobacterium versatile]|uniref:RICIN domain-containing protein n=1 Tax=Pectobacterium versatile TaxID=2488639 RepID=UPI001CC93B83|nr:RICIN domain-containing protein [Pectobacterium versatile]
MIGILKYAGNQELALGVSDQQKDAQAVLLRADSSLDKILWNLDSRTGVISLAISDGALALAIKNKAIASGTDLVLQLTNQNEVTQKWDFSSKPGFIFSQANKSYVIDDDTRGGAGTRVQLFDFNGSIAQQWKFVPIDRISALASE